MIALRKARLDDADAVTRVVCETWRKSYAAFLPAEIIEKGTDFERKLCIEKELLTDEDTYVAVAEIDKSIIGMGVVDSSGYIRQLYVLPDFQSGGVGSLLYTELEKAALKFGCEELTLDTLESSEQSNGFYKKHGFCSIEKNPTDFLGGIICAKYRKGLSK